MFHLTPSRTLKTFGFLICDVSPSVDEKSAVDEDSINPNYTLSGEDISVRKSVISTIGEILRNAKVRSPNLWLDLCLRNLLHNCRCIHNCWIICAEVCSR